MEYVHERSQERLGYVHVPDLEVDASHAQPLAS
jgi:hypothetical protein